MTTKQAIKHFGGRRWVAQALNISVQAVHKWGKRPPPLRQVQMEKITEGRLKADAV